MSAAASAAMIDCGAGGGGGGGGSGGGHRSVTCGAAVAVGRGRCLHHSCSCSFSHFFRCWQFLGGLLHIGSGGCGLLLLLPLRTVAHAHNASTMLYLWRAE